MARIVVIDNYDSFTYNLVQYLETLGARCDVVLNDACDVGGIASAMPQGIVISPGPCTPDEAGVSLGAVMRLSGTVPILGVCLGTPVDRPSLRRARDPRRTPDARQDVAHLARRQDRSSKGLPSRSPRPATIRCSSNARRLPDVARGERVDGRRRKSWGCGTRSLPVEGVQFHPESILTEEGMQAAQELGRLHSAGELHELRRRSRSRGLQERSPARRASTELGARRLRRHLLGRWTPAQVAGFVVALRMRGEVGRP